MKSFENPNLGDSGISPLVFPSRTSIRLHNISITSKKVITNLDLSKVSAPAYIPVAVLKK